jgi:hypothetical protein
VTVANYFVILTLHKIIRIVSSKTLDTIYRKGTKGVVCVLLNSRGANVAAVTCFLRGIMKGPILPASSAAPFTLKGSLFWRKSPN